MSNFIPKYEPSPYKKVSDAAVLSPLRFRTTTGHTSTVSDEPAARTLTMNFFQQRHNTLSGVFPNISAEPSPTTPRFNHLLEHKETSAEGSSVKEEVSGFYATKCLCLISRYPLFNFMQTFLTQLFQYVFRDSPSQNLAAWEYYVCTLVNVPFPLRGEVPINLAIPTPDSSNSVVQYTTIQVPTCMELPMVDLPIRYIFQTLDLECVITLLFAALLERRIVFTSKRNALLTYAALALHLLIYPFSYPHTFIPVLPAALVECIEAPTPFIMGINSLHLSQLSHVDLSGIIFVDLDNCHVRIPETETIPVLPQIAVDNLKAKLRPHIHPEFDTIDRAFPLPVDWALHENQIRIACAIFFTNLVNDYFNGITIDSEESALFKYQPEPLHGKQGFTSLL